MQIPARATGNAATREDAVGYADDERFEDGTFGTGEYREGEVDWFSAEKGYGFINMGLPVQVFVHYSQIQMDGYRSLTSGDLVGARIQWTTKRGSPEHRGVQAFEVERLERLERKD